MSSMQHLQQSRDALQAELKILTEKEARLRTSRAIETDIGVCFKLEKQLEAVEAQQTQLHQKLSRIDSERLYSRLVNLNYFDQTLAFRKFLSTQRVGAFLVHGEANHGQYWLLKRLLTLLSDPVSISPIHFRLRSLLTKCEAQSLWHKLGAEIGLPRVIQSELDLHSQIVERIVRRLENQNVVLMFHDLDCMYEAFAASLIRDFWSPLASSVQTAIRSESRFHLLAFLIDNTGEVSSWKVNFADRIEDAGWSPMIPIRLPTITHFRPDELSFWFRDSVDVVPVRHLANIDETVRMIMDRTQGGIPGYVLEQIHILCDCAGYEGEETWMEL